MRRVPVLPLILFATILAAGEAPDELDALLAEVKPPARFATHAPHFAIEEIQHTFTGKDGPEIWGFFLIKDGDRCIGYVPKVGFHGGTIYLVSHDPAEAGTTPPLPSERFHIDVAQGAAFRTDHFLPDDNGAKNWGFKDQSTWTVGDGGATLTLERKFAGKHVFKKWEHSSPKGDKEGIQVDHTGTFVIECHPQLGYTIDATWKTGLKPVITGQYVSLMPPWLSNPWYGDRIHQRVAICSAKAPGWIGHANNHVAIDRCDNDTALWTLRDGGFATYLDKTRGWSWTQTLSGGNAPLSVCNVHADQDLLVEWPKGQAPEADGLTWRTVRVRQVRLPPELTNVVWDKMTMRLTDGQMVVMPVGKLNDFENQPQSTGENAIGLTFGGGGMPEISQTEAHSGSRSMVVNGTVWPNLPQVALKPNLRYRVEAWYKVNAPTEADIAKMKEDFQARIERDRAAREAKAAKAAKAGKEAPPAYVAPEWQEPGPATGRLAADFYLWSPHNAGDFTLRQSTGEAKAGAGWQRVWIEFDAPAWGPFVDIRFVTSNGGKGFVDDFFIKEVGPATGAATASGVDGG